MSKIAMRLRRMTKVGRKNMFELFCVNTGMMQQSQNYTVLKIKKKRKKLKQDKVLLLSSGLWR